jgi:5-(carboxyamino)imidazole ribonucleotide synthase
MYWQNVLMRGVMRFPRPSQRCPKMSNTLPQGARIGILGGGQLGRMLSVAASRLGFLTHIYEPGANPPAAQVADDCTMASYEDTEALHAFAQSVDVITYEFENIPTDALDVLETIKPIYPNREALQVSQDRITEKDYLNDLGLTTAPYAQVDTLADLQAAAEKIGLPAILKTRRFGYDGKGQSRLKSTDDIETAHSDMAGAPSVLEGFVNFSREISVIAARGMNGEIACYDPGENVHRDGILHTTTIPAEIPAMMAMDAALMAGKILNAMDYVGVMGVEMFVTPQGLIVNEIAPRVHNSGHWTQNGCAVDQFEQHIRAVAGWPLGDGSRYLDVVMENLIGADMDRVPDLSKDPKVSLHLYGKADVKKGRKMGHFNRVTSI